MGTLSHGRENQGFVTGSGVILIAIVLWERKWGTSGGEGRGMKTIWKSKVGGSGHENIPGRDSCG